MILEFEDDFHQRQQADRQRISETVVRQFTPRVAKEKPGSPGMIRPIDNLCRSCTMRPPVGRSKLCRQCIEISVRIARDHRRNRPTFWLFLLFGIAALLVTWSLSEWLDLAEKQQYQRPATKITGQR